MVCSVPTIASRLRSDLRSSTSADSSIARWRFMSVPANIGMTAGAVVKRSA